jgi:hypothetical protein
MIEIELDANYVYYIIVSKKHILDKYIKNKYENKILMCIPINTPITNICNTIEEQIGIDVIIDTSIESTQCFLLMSGIYDKLYMLIVLEKKKDNTLLLTFPKFSLQPGDNPEKICLNNIKSEYNINLTSELKKSINPLTIVGINDDILVMVSSYK